MAHQEGLRDLAPAPLLVRSPSWRIRLTHARQRVRHVGGRYRIRRIVGLAMRGRVWFTYTVRSGSMTRSRTYYGFRRWRMWRFPGVGSFADLDEATDALRKREAIKW